MTPERAGELAETTFTFPPDMYSVGAKQAILQACAEEREACAKIALASQSSAGYDICQIIRGAK